MGCRDLYRFLVLEAPRKDVSLPPITQSIQRQGKKGELEFGGDPNAASQHSKPGFGRWYFFFFSV